MKGIILHGGHGTRLRPLTHTGPKQLLPIANKPMSQFCLEAISETGIKEIAIVIGGIGSNKVREYYGDGEKFGVNVTYIEQDKPRGIAHAIRLCKDFINNEKFLVFLGDNIIQKSITDFVNNFKNSDYDATVLLCEVDNPSRFGIADIENEKILKITEKPKNPTSNLAVTGIYLLTPLIFEIIDNLKPSWRNELEITDALDNLLRQNNNISFERITDYWKDTGTPEDIIHANGEIIKKMLGNLENDHIIGKDTVIESNVKINGPVVIGDNCHISSGSSIGPNVSVGNNTTVAISNIENSIVMENCKINSSAEIKNSIIANNSDIKDDEGDKKIFLLGEGSKVSL
ncbi:glucose-1-phosphate thymidylyltransferase [Candidatus Nitrosopelagicus sp.]|nr:glucose-1-phosphate thymidylyltransferase [Candidatus Nitrosopelagicus sp.]